MPIEWLKRQQIAVLLSTALVTFSSGAWANATGEQVVAGQAQFARNGSNLVITQGTQRVIINWQDFSNNNGELTKFIQPNSSAAALNRVISGNPSALLGDLEANGHIYLINPNGIVVGAGANINTQSFIASTLDVDNAEFMNGGDLNFVGDSQKTIENLGTINGGNGDVFLIAKHVENSGTIKAEGHVGLAGGNDVLLKASGDDRMAVRVTDKDGRIDQKGLVEATKIELRTAGNNPYALAINHEGISRATSAVNKQGRIILFAEGGTTKADGTFDASAPESGDGGFIETSGTHVKIAETVKIDTSSKNGETGTWLIDPNDFTIAATGGDISATTLATQLASNNIAIETATQGTAGGNGDIFVNETITSSSTNSLTLDAERNIEVNQSISLGGDVILITGDGNNGSGTGATGEHGGHITVNQSITSTLGNIQLTTGNGGIGAANAIGNPGGTGGVGGNININAALDAGQDISLTAGNGGIAAGGNIASSGGTGGTGGNVTINAALNAAQDILLTAGRGGSGGSGGDAASSGPSVFTSGGGSGGEGGVGGSISVNASLDAGQDIQLTTGKGGDGGRGGEGGRTSGSTLYVSAGGIGGSGGSGGSVTVNSLLNTGQNLQLTAGSGGSAGFGGVGEFGFASNGFAGEGGNIFINAILNAGQNIQLTVGAGDSDGEIQGNQIDATANNGSITIDGFINPDAGGSVSLLAGTAAGQTLTFTTPQDFNLSSAGSLSLRGFGFSSANNYSTVDGDININSGEGELNLTGIVTATNGDVTLSSGGNLSASQILSANNINLTATGTDSAIGTSGSAIQTNASGIITANASNGTGGIFLSNTGGNLNIGGADAGTGGIHFTADNINLNSGNVLYGGASTFTGITSFNGSNITGTGGTTFSNDVNFNAGIINMNDAIMNFNGATAFNGGTINANSQFTTFNFNGDITSTGGVLNHDRSILNFNSNSTDLAALDLNSTNGFLNFSGGASATFVTGADTDINSRITVNSGTTLSHSGSSGLSAGTLVVNGTLNLGGGTANVQTLAVNHGATLNATAQGINVSGSGSASTIFGLLNHNGQTVSIAGDLEGSGIIVSGNGLLRFAGNDLTTVDLSDISITMDPTGTLELFNGVDLDYGSSALNIGHFTISGAGANTRIDGVGLLGVLGDFTLASNTGLLLNGSSGLLVSGQSQINGTVFSNSIGTRSLILNGGASFGTGAGFTATSLSNLTVDVTGDVDLSNVGTVNAGTNEISLIARDGELITGANPLNVSGANVRFTTTEDASNNTASDRNIQIGSGGISGATTNLTITSTDDVIIDGAIIAASVTATVGDGKHASGTFADASTTTIAETGNAGERGGDVVVNQTITSTVGDINLTAGDGGVGAAGQNGDIDNQGGDGGAGGRGGNIVIAAALNSAQDVILTTGEGGIGREGGDGGGNDGTGVGGGIGGAGGDAGDINITSTITAANNIYLTTARGGDSGTGGDALIGSSGSDGDTGDGGDIQLTGLISSTSGNINLNTGLQGRFGGGFGGPGIAGSHGKITGGDIDVRASSGSIHVAGEITPDVNADISLLAGTQAGQTLMVTGNLIPGGGGAANTASDINLTGSGNLTLQGFGFTFDKNISTETGNININSGDGTLSLTSTLSSTNGDVSLTSGDALTVTGAITASNGDVDLTSVGDLNVSQLITANNISFLASGLNAAIGNSNFIQTNTPNIINATASNGNGGIFLGKQGDFDISNAINLNAGTGDIALTAFDGQLFTDSTTLNVVANNLTLATTEVGNNNTVGDRNITINSGGINAATTNIIFNSTDDVVINGAVNAASVTATTGSGNSISGTFDDPSTTTTAQTGNTGERSGDIIVNQSITTHVGDINFTTERGGGGVPGENGNLTLGMTTQGGTGGAGGRSGNIVIAADINSAQDVILITGEGGQGNTGGEGGSESLGIGGGTGGAGGKSGDINVTGSVTATRDINFTTGRGGDAGDGGDSRIGAGGTSGDTADSGDLQLAGLVNSTTGNITLNTGLEGRHGFPGSGGAFGILGSAGKITGSDINVRADAGDINVNAEVAASAGGNVSLLAGTASGQTLNFATVQDINLTSAGNLSLRGFGFNSTNNFSTVNGDITINSGDGDLTLNTGFTVTSTGSGNIILAGNNFHNDTGTNNPLSVNTGRFVVYSTRPDINRDDIGTDTNAIVHDFVQYDTSFDSNNPLPSSPTGNGFFYSVQPVLTGVDVTVDDQSFAYGGVFDNTLFTFNSAGGFSYEVNSVAINTAEFELNAPTSLTAADIDLALDSSITSSNAGFITAGTYTDGIEAVIASGSSFEGKGIALSGFGDLTVSKRDLNVTVAVDNKVYDATTDATLSIDSITAGDLLTGDLVSIDAGTSMFDSKDVGTRTVTLVGESLTGADANNYNLNITGSTLSADITQADLIVNNAGVLNKVYDQTTTATVINGSVSALAGDNVNLNLDSANFSDKNVGNNKTVTANYSISGGDASNYNLIQATGLAANITQRTLNASLTANDKVYDATTAATGVFGDDRIGGDVLTITGTSIFGSKDVGARTVTSTGLVLSGTDAGNYMLASTTVNDNTVQITQAALNVTANNDTKVFDGVAYTGGNGVSYAGFVGGETAAVLGGAINYSGNSQGATNPGSYIITPGGLTSNNYALNFVNGGLTINSATVGGGGSGTSSGGSNTPGGTFTSFQSQQNNNVNPPNTGSNNNRFTAPPGFSFNSQGGNNFGNNSPFPLRLNLGNGAPRSMSRSSSFDNDNDDE